MENVVADTHLKRPLLWTPMILKETVLAKSALEKLVRKEIKRAVIQAVKEVKET